MTAPQNIIAQLESLDCHSNEFYDVSMRYFCHRLRVIRACGFLCLFLAVLALSVDFVLWGQWILVLENAVVFFVGVFLGWKPFITGKLGIHLIDDARWEDIDNRLVMLRRLAAGSFRRDPVSAFVLQRLARV